MTRYYNSFSQQIIVLKFGSSILKSFADYRYVIDEIKRFIDKKYKVIAVVSAIGNTTNNLINEQLKYSNQKLNTNTKSYALFLATGELQSAAYITSKLQEEGFKSDLIDNPIIAEGSYDEANPIDIYENLFNESFNNNQVIVVPGFIASNRLNETCLLGRGGSDLTALFIAHKLKARCILLKDVDGIYEDDPKLYPKAKRLNRLTYDYAINKVTQAVQNRAIIWAQENYLAFEIGAINSNSYTTLGALQNSFINSDNDRFFKHSA
ncbi:MULTISPECIES: amino acid kinase family protein [unclassified Francisella]|uniref:amino acid kinase family protein n=1 Tax=unclassified Francisella TaxID=2610885 RepID=UPI002E36E534|nr:MULTISPECIES: hypothetical protein [unclassified Francisella]MED7818324.1 hypothetical protein [Francisella sp. 19S2-4]MED7829160.1 hypothetical protein [Francisella sp. 19S2-10]